ncbi:MAG: hypothetical protein GVY15_07630 [Bacteroidetes bacterium]|nr:hypothetical protein [Bacteroidota bacterium]
MLLGPTAAAQPASTVEGVALTVEDLDRALPFYRDVLHFELVDTGTVTDESIDRLFGVFGSRLRSATLQLGTERITLLEFVCGARHRPPLPG